MKLETEDKIEIVAEAEQKKEIKLIGQKRKIPGLTLWEFNLKTQELKKAEFEKITFNLHSMKMPDDLEIKHKVIVNENCLYVQALNKKNAVKQIIKRLKND